MAALEVAEHRLSMLRTVAGDQELMDRYFATLAGVIGVEEFFTPDLHAREELTRP
ncbi:hypothetical protein RB199_29975 [Streptomyces libani]